MSGAEASRRAILDAVRDAARPFAADLSEEVFRVLIAGTGYTTVPAVIGATVAAVAVAVLGAAEPLIRADEREAAREREAVLLRNWHGDRDKICAIRAWGEARLPAGHLTELLAILEGRP